MDFSDSPRTVDLQQRLQACVIDGAMQVFGAMGMSDDPPLAYFYTVARTLRFADGPDEVHRNSIAKIELGKLRHSA